MVPSARILLLGDLNHWAVVQLADPLPLARDIGGTALLTISFPTTLLTLSITSRRLSFSCRSCSISPKSEVVAHSYPDRGVSEWFFLALQYGFWSFLVKNLWASPSIARFRSRRSCSPKQLALLFCFTTGAIEALLEGPTSLAHCAV